MTTGVTRGMAGGSRGAFWAVFAAPAVWIMAFFVVPLSVIWA